MSPLYSSDYGLFEQSKRSRMGNSRTAVNRATSQEKGDVPTHLEQARYFRRHLLPTQEWLQLARSTQRLTPLSWCAFPAPQSDVGSHRYSTVYWHYKQWREAGVIEALMNLLHGEVREQIGKKQSGQR
jgi:hypothetical protein